MILLVDLYDWVNAERFTNYKTSRGVDNLK
jgi:hypothetical protein